jgi:hypothetical protein
MSEEPDLAEVSPWQGEVTDKIRQKIYGNIMDLAIGIFLFSPPLFPFLFPEQRSDSYKLNQVNDMCQYYEFSYVFFLSSLPSFSAIFIV